MAVWHQLAPETSGTRCSRIRPRPLGSCTSTAIATVDFASVSLPVTPSSLPPTVGLVDLDTPAEPLTIRAHHRDTKAVQHHPRGLVAAEPERALQPERAETLLLAGEDHAAANHSVSGVRVLSKIVPAVTDVLPEHPAHTQRPRPVRHPRRPPHEKHTMPSGQRNSSRYAAHAASSGNHARKSDHVPG